MYRGLPFLVRATKHVILRTLPLVHFLKSYGIDVLFQHVVYILLRDSDTCKAFEECHSLMARVSQHFHYQGKIHA